MRMTRCIFLIVFYLLLLLSASSQNLFLIEKPGTVKNVKFHEGDDIHVSVKHYPPGTDIKGSLTQIGDSSIVIDDMYLIPIKDITAVYIERFWIKLAIPVLFIAGIGYGVLEIFNNAINKDSPLLSKETAIISSSLVAGGLVLIPLIERKYTIGEKWRVQSLVFDYENFQ